jgi:hypothetical protein
MVSIAKQEANVDESEKQRDDRYLNLVRPKFEKLSSLMTAISTETPKGDDPLL